MILYFAAQKKKCNSETCDSGSISTSHINKIIDKLRYEQNCDMTQKNFLAIWRVFSNFFFKLDIKPDNWTDRLPLFVGYLIDKNRRSSTIKSYVSAIKAVLREDGKEIKEDKFLLASLVRACKFHNDLATVCFPIHKQLLDILLKGIDKLFLSTGNNNQPYLAIKYKAMFASAYYGLFRIGEIATGTHPILAKDVHIGQNKQKILIVLWMSKTHGKDSFPQSVKITAMKIDNFRSKWDQSNHKTNNLFCPYALLKRYLRVQSKYISDQEPFFVFRDRTPVSTGNVTLILKHTLRECGFDARKYSMHGMRTGCVGD